MSFSISKIAKKACPRCLRGFAVWLLRRSRALRYRFAMLIHPRKMQYFCPCCGIRFGEFVAGDYKERPKRFNPERYENTRQDVLCPVCSALPRHRILALWSEEHKQLLKSAKILYFAPEYSMMKWMKKNGVSCTTADLFSKADLKLDIQATGLPDDSYDVIICNHVMEHVDDFRKAMREMHRILRPGGSFICSFPMDPKVELLDEDESVLTEEEMLNRFGQNDHKRVFGMKADQFLTEAGFEVVRIDGKDYPDEILPVVGPADYDMNVLFWGKKAQSFDSRKTS